MVGLIAVFDIFLCKRTFVSAVIVPADAGNLPSFRFSQTIVYVWRASHPINRFANLTSTE